MLVFIGGYCWLVVVVMGSHRWWSLVLADDVGRWWWSLVGFVSGGLWWWLSVWQLVAVHHAIALTCHPWGHNSGRTGTEGRAFAFGSHVWGSIPELCWLFPACLRPFGKAWSSHCHGSLSHNWGLGWTGLIPWRGKPPSCWSPSRATISSYTPQGADKLDNGMNRSTCRGTTESLTIKDNNLVIFNVCVVCCVSMCIKPIVTVQPSGCKEPIKHYYTCNRGSSDDDHYGFWHYKYF